MWWVLVRAPRGCAAIRSDGEPFCANRSQTQRLSPIVWTLDVNGALQSKRFLLFVLLLDERCLIVTMRDVERRLAWKSTLPVVSTHEVQVRCEGSAKPGGAGPESRVLVIQQSGGVMD